MSELNKDMLTFLRLDNRVALLLTLYFVVLVIPVFQLLRFLNCTDRQRDGCTDPNYRKASLLKIIDAAITKSFASPLSKH